MKRINGVMLAVLMALSGMVFAEAGGESNNTDCNGVGNPNSPCAGTLQENTVPEPGTLVLLGAGVIGLVVGRRKK